MITLAKIKRQGYVTLKSIFSAFRYLSTLLSFKNNQENLPGTASDYVYNLQRIKSNLILQSNVSEPTSHFQFTLFIWDLFQNFCPLKITTKFCIGELLIMYKIFKKLH